MKRHSIALLLHPYKNILLQENVLSKAINIFAEKVLELTATFQSLRLNIILPGYIMQYIDPLLQAKLREVQKSDRLEWLTSGFTEPFISFSPQWLTRENIKYGIETFNELMSCRPSGYVPAFSNWEPSSIEMFRECAINYVVLSRTLLPRNERDLCGYWITEHAGSTTLVFPAHILHHHNAPADIPAWIDSIIDKDQLNPQSVRLLTIEYLIPLAPDRDADPYQWLYSVAQTLDSLLIKYQIIRIGEFSSISYPIGLQYIPPSIVFKRDDDETSTHFYNYLHTFDQVGIIQRKMMDAAERICSRHSKKEFAPILKQLFFVQDINRFLPKEKSGFSCSTDRQWTYSKLIEIEQQLLKLDNIQRGQIKIVDFLKNGTKSIILSNRSLKIYLDHKGGGQIFELDYRDRPINLCSGFYPHNFDVPRIISCGSSLTSFIDYFLDIECKKEDFIAGQHRQFGDFINGQFDYKIKKTEKGVKAILSRQGAVTFDDKNYPIMMEKVFGLESDSAALSFVYQLSNPSLASYNFKFAFSLNLLLPGVQLKRTQIIEGKTKKDIFTWDKISIENATGWVINDSIANISMHFTLQKPATLWVFPASDNKKTNNFSNGTTLVISSPVSLNENAVWSLIGKIVFKKTRTKGSPSNEIRSS